MEIAKLIDDENWLREFCDRVRRLLPVEKAPHSPVKKWILEEAMKLDDGIFNKFRNRLALSNVLFNDPDFNPSRRGLIGTAAPPFSIAWLRPPRIFDSPEPPVLLTTTQHEPYRMSKSGYGSKCLAAVIHAVSFNDALRSRVMPDDQSFSNDYAGIFRFRFWHFGEWIPVVIDDRLPVRKKTRHFVFNSFSNMPDIWVCLVEKAYAKFVGGYGEIKKFTLLDILRHFTGGVGEFYNVKEMKTLEMTSIKMGLNRGSLIMALLSNGNDCFYNVRGIYKNKESGEIFVRLWNPFDIDEMSKEETLILRSPHDDLIERNCLDLAPDYKNTLWMTLKEFIAKFSYILVCNPRDAELSHNTDGHWCSLQKWNFFTVSSNWVSKETYGSPCSEVSPVYCNSQIRFRVTTSDYEREWKTSRCTVIASLLQRRDQKEFNRKDLHSISLLVYDLLEPEKEPFKLSQKYFDLHEPFYQSFQYPEVEVSVRLHLDPGTYVLIPVTDRYEMEEEYLLTLCSVNPVEPVLPLSKICITDANLVEASIECRDSAIMGDPVEGFVYVTNKFNKAKRIFYIVLTERIRQENAQPIAAKIGLIKLGPMLSLVIPVRTTFFEYADLVQLKLKNIAVRFSCNCYIYEDTNFAYVEKIVDISLPPLDITTIGPVLVGEKCSIQAAWTNTLPITIQRGTFRLDNSYRHVDSVATVEPYGTVRQLFENTYYRAGWNEITVDFGSHILDIRESLRLMIEDSFE